MTEKPFVVARIPAYEDERTIGTVIDRVGNCVDGIESAVLGVELMKILVNLRNALKGGFAKRMEEYGALRAKKLVAQAAEWGNGTARECASDIGLIRYLTLIDMNRPSGFGV